MILISNLRAKPFYLNDEQIAWVEETYASMDTLEKVQQLFVQMNHDRREESIKTKVEPHRHGGLRWQGGDAKANLLQNMTFQKVPFSQRLEPSVYGNIMKAKQEYNIEQHISEEVIADIANWINTVIL